MEQRIEEISYKPKFLQAAETLAAEKGVTVDEYLKMMSDRVMNSTAGWDGEQVVYEGPK